MLSSTDRIVRDAAHSRESDETNNMEVVPYHRLVWCTSRAELGRNRGEQVGQDLCRAVTLTL